MRENDEIGMEQIDQVPLRRGSLAAPRECLIIQHKTKIQSRRSTRLSGDLRFFQSRSIVLFAANVFLTRRLRTLRDSPESAESETVRAAGALPGFASIYPIPTVNRILAIYSYTPTPEQSTLRVGSNS